MLSDILADNLILLIRVYLIVIFWRNKIKLNLIYSMVKLTLTQ